MGLWRLVFYDKFVIEKFEALGGIFRFQIHLKIQFS